MNSTFRKVLAQIRNFIVISMVTLLIWLLAEAESLRVERIRTEVAFAADPATDRYIRADPDFPAAVTMRLEGSTARVDDLATRLRRPLRLAPGMEGIPIEPGRHTIDLRSVIRNMPLVRETGASVADVDPPIASVVIDRLVTREFRVRAEAPAGAALEGPPEATPQTVRVRMPEALAAMLGGDYQITAPLDVESLANLPEGRRSTLRDIGINLPEPLRGADGVRVLPSSVSVAVTVRSRTAQAVLPTVPVHVRIAPTETGIWDIQMPAESRILNDVTVSGPSDVIEQIRTERLRPIAYVPLSFEELERAAASGEPISKEPVFADLPTTLKFEVRPAQRTIRLSVSRREAPAGGTPNAGAATPLVPNGR